MKLFARIFLICISIFYFSNCSMAQLRLGVNVGYNNPTFVNNEIYLTTVSHIKSLQAGLVGEIQLQHHLFLNMGLSIITNGGNIDMNYIDAGSNQTIRATYIQLPINIGIKFPVYKSLKILVDGGIYAANGIYGTQKGWYSSIAGPFPINNTIRFTNDNNRVAGKLNMHPFDFGYQFSTGVEWKNLQLRFQFTHGLKNFFPIQILRIPHIIETRLS
jgi:hypothetical protein